MSCSKALDDGCIVTGSNDKILDWSKFKAFADDKINVTEKLKFVLGTVENIVGNRRKCSHSVFKRLKILIWGPLKEWYRVNLYHTIPTANDPENIAF